MTYPVDPGPRRVLWHRISARMWPMDDQGTWPTPLPPEGSTAERDFDRQVMDELRSDPQALRQIGGVKGNVWIVLAPVVAVILLIPAWLQWRSTGSGLWLAVLAAILAVATLVWISRVKAVMGQARQVLGSHLVGSVGYGIGVVRSIRFPDPADDDDVVADLSTPADGTPDADQLNTQDPHDPQEADLPAEVPTVEVELTMAVSPVQGKGFTATSTQRYATVDALRLEAGQHGPVRYLRRDPANTTAVETRLEPEAVQKIYRAAALN